MIRLKPHTISTLLAALALVPLAAVTIAAQESIETPVIASGAGVTVGGGAEVAATIGEPFHLDDVMTGADEETVWIGFWAVIPSDPSSVREERIAGSISSTHIAALAPNPFTDRLAVEIGLGSSGHVVVAVHDALGREVARLVDGRREIGAHRITWRPGELPAGAYIVRLELDGVIIDAAPIQHYR